ncbi:hypothetical protein Kpol_1065p45 [Vanderwaltozyma polyspora DSM 70294]|uniref:UBC core domain-containing protein n=1 Tax=Vanderwaltozyma polyspora (strain ATCC 22028 / DSM 70294 / BCRC 21397 / CBS 2163 / NBRC 10782 / NRRL Y-8283 / UCD 57-17) TaxID=436907 RepID=A7TL65_VANPO|nr:uncharacterized protein Kpol_1065p45 [Vanderwaltozyma polyspora DSM 70294]EDO17028.1 hypothetical protein Kpol_1065p45 [Vanderwaltozyma polyspora DSM 70294]
MSNRKSTAASLLLRQYRELTNPKKAIPSFHINLEDDSNIFVWNIGVMVLNEDSIYHGGYFKAQMRFPDDFPFSPPQFRFTPAIYHPNVYRDGRLCISILHQSGDPMTDELDAETWSPVQTVESVLISIVSLLEDPNISSPANVDAAVDYRKNPEQYKQRVKMEVERSKQDIPQGFIMPTSDSAYVSAQHNSKYNKGEESNDVYSNNNNNNGGGNVADGNSQHHNSVNSSHNNDIADNFWYDSDLDEDEDDINNNYGSNINDSNSMIYDDDDVYNYQGEYEEDFEEDDESIDNDSVMDRKQPKKPDADIEEEEEELQENMGEKL